MVGTCMRLRDKRESALADVELGADKRRCSTPQAGARGSRDTDARVCAPDQRGSRAAENGDGATAADSQGDKRCTHPAGGHSQVCAGVCAGVDRHRQTDRQTDTHTHTGTQTHIHTQRQTDTHARTVCARIWLHGRFLARRRRERLEAEAIAALNAAGRPPPSVDRTALLGRHSGRGTAMKGSRSRSRRGSVLASSQPPHHSSSAQAPQCIDLSSNGRNEQQQQSLQKTKRRSTFARTEPPTEMEREVAALTIQLWWRQVRVC